MDYPPIILDGPQAFYNQPDYHLTNLQEFNQPDALETVHYRFETEPQWVRVLKIVGAILILPIGIAWGLHAFVGKIIVPVFQDPKHISIGKFLNDSALSKQMALDMRKKLSMDSIETDSHSLVLKRITVEVNGNKIDGMMVGTRKTIYNGRWVLNSIGNSDLYENHLATEPGCSILESPFLGKMVSALDSNMVLFNYPGKGASEGFRERKALGNTYRAMLKFIEDRLDAKEIILYGHSLGTVVQKEGLKKHKFKDDIKYVAVKSRGPSSLSDAAGCMTKSRAAKAAVWAFGWNASGTPSRSKPLKCPEIILQTMKEPGKEVLKLAKKEIRNLIQKYVKKSKTLDWDQGIFIPSRTWELGLINIKVPDMHMTYEDIEKFYKEAQDILLKYYTFRPLTGPEEVGHDKLFTPEVTIAKKVLESGKTSRKRQVFGVNSDHNQPIYDWKPIAKVIKKALASQ